MARINFIKDKAITTLFWEALFILICMSSVNGTIRVISLTENETVYTIQERALILRSSDGLEGILIKSEPPNACSTVQPPPEVNGTYLYNWILLTTWQGLQDPCPILRKIRYAEEAGYSAIIIQTSPENDSDFIPVSDWYEISIFPCLVAFEDGRVLGANFTTEEYLLRFEDEPMNTWLGFFIASVLVILAILLAIGLSYVIVQMFVLVLLWIRETIVNTIQQRRRDRRRRLPASQLKKLPIQQWTTDIPQDTCTICLDNFIPDDRVRVLPCSHVFHTACIDPWLLNQRRKCPNCKGKISFPDEHNDSDTSSTEDERTPLIRRGSSGGERDRTQIFNFNDASRLPAYTAIHRIFDELPTTAAIRPRPVLPQVHSSNSIVSTLKEAAENLDQINKEQEDIKTQKSNDDGNPETSVIVEFPQDKGLSFKADDEDQTQCLSNSIANTEQMLGKSSENYQSQDLVEEINSTADGMQENSQISKYITAVVGNEKAEPGTSEDGESISQNIHFN